MKSYFETLKDPRIERTKRHLLVDIICLAICAVIAGAEGWEEIEDFGVQREEWLRTFLELPHGIPSHDTISRVFRALSPVAFRECFLEWTATLQDKLGLRHIAVDGKTLRGSHDRCHAKTALQTVCAWSVANQLVLGQQAVPADGNEISALPDLLKQLELKGAIVSIDAIGCQKEIAAQIIDGGGDYVLSVKDNQPHLSAAVEAHFTELHCDSHKFPRGQHTKTVEDAHGRHTERHYYQTPIPAELRETFSEWKKVESFGQTITEVTTAAGTTSSVRYYVSSLSCNARRFGECVRGHWGIENSLHWVLDVSYREDACRIRKDHGPENFGLLRRATLGLIKRDTSKGSVRRKRKRAAWNNDELLSILQAKA
jgi:predicted transposase YbfD/YdcC